MLLLWILASWATEPEPPSPAPIEGAAVAPAAPAETAPPTVSVSVTLPEGSVIHPVARELVRGGRSRAVAFAVDGKPSVRDGLLIVRGVLSNSGSKETKVYLESAPHTGGPFVLVPRDVTYGAEAPTGLVGPAELVLPPGGKAVFESAIVLDKWSWPAEGAEVDWAFRFWKDPVKGTLPGLLRPP